MVSWRQFSVEETGVHKISKDFLRKLDLPVQEIDPRTIRIFGRGGQMLPLKAGDEIETLYENALIVEGEEDGSFDDEDYILFMGYANDTWNKESETYLNLYHDTAQYYIYLLLKRPYKQHWRQHLYQDFLFPLVPKRVFQKKCRK